MTPEQLAHRAHELGYVRLKDLEACLGFRSDTASAYASNRTIDRTNIRGAVAFNDKLLRTLINYTGPKNKAAIDRFVRAAQGYRRPASLDFPTVISNKQDTACKLAARAFTHYGATAPEIEALVPGVRAVLALGNERHSPLVIQNFLKEEGSPLAKRVAVYMLQHAKAQTKQPAPAVTTDASDPALPVAATSSKATRAPVQRARPVKETALIKQTVEPRKTEQATFSHGFSKLPAYTQTEVIGYTNQVLDTGMFHIREFCETLGISYDYVRTMVKDRTQPGRVPLNNNVISWLLEYSPQPPSEHARYALFRTELARHARRQTRLFSTEADGDAQTQPAETTATEPVVTAQATAMAQPTTTTASAKTPEITDRAPARLVTIKARRDNSRPFIEQADQNRGLLQRIRTLWT